MQIQRSARRLAALAIAAGTITVATILPAAAAPADNQVGSGSCVAIEKFSFWGGHDHITNDPIVNDASDPYGCYFSIEDLSGNEVEPGSGSGAELPWVEEDGRTLRACVYLYRYGTVKSKLCGIAY